MWEGKPVVYSGRFFNLSIKEGAQQKRPRSMVIRRRQHSYMVIAGDGNCEDEGSDWHSASQAGRLRKHCCCRQMGNDWELRKQEWMSHT